MTAVTVERALKRVEGAVRGPVEPASVASFGKVRLNAGRVSLFGHQVIAVEALESALATDLRFEHMKTREIEIAVQEFADLACRQRSKSHAPSFIAKHAQEPVVLTCSFPVEGLTLHRAFEIGNVSFAPPDGAEIPAAVVHPDLDTRVDCIATAPCRGTSGRAMMRRARRDVEHALRAIRAGLRQQQHGQRLRFRLGTCYWFSGGGGGWQSRRDSLPGLSLTEELMELALATPIAALPADGGSKVQQCARRALGWFDRAEFETDPALAVSLLFFALKAILGDSEEGLKGDRLAIRRALLSSQQTGSFAPPAQTARLYKEARSGTVHGEDPLRVSDRELRAFKSDVRAALDEFLEYAQLHKAKRRIEVTRKLDEDPFRTEVEARL